LQRLAVNRQLLATLANADRPIEICDLTGKTIGYFVPALEYDRALFDWAIRQISDEELGRRKVEVDGRSTREVLERLYQIGKAQ
jgi:hypothetical protein